MNFHLSPSFHKAIFCTIRLKPGDDLLVKLREFIQSEQIEAAFIASCVGSLSQVSLRYAGKKEAVIRQQSFDVISLVGTAEVTGKHIHLSISDENGVVTGGHVMEGCIVRTTLEIVVGALDNCKYKRELCELSGNNELTVNFPTDD